jgi:Ras-related protein Rab-5C
MPSCISANNNTQENNQNTRSEQILPNDDVIGCPGKHGRNSLKTRIVIMTSLSRKFKVVLLGASAAGKTSIVIRFCKGTFSQGQEPTIGAAFISRDITTRDGIVSLHVWDTAGQERYRSLVPKYSQGAAAIIIVYDATDPDSFAAAQACYAETHENLPSGVVWFLVANKCDLPPTVDPVTARDFANEKDLIFVETSAMTGQGVSDLFLEVAQAIPKLPAAGDTLDLRQPAGPPKPDGCC